MPRTSQYLHAYLEDAAKDLAQGRAPLTPGSYLHYRLQGRAKRYNDVYLRALIRALEAEPDVIEVRSRKGGIAYCRHQHTETC